MLKTTYGDYKILLDLRVIPESSEVKINDDMSVSISDSDAVNRAIESFAKYDQLHAEIIGSLIELTGKTKEEITFFFDGMSSGHRLAKGNFLRSDIEKNEIMKQKKRAK